MELAFSQALQEAPDLAHRLRRLSFFDQHFRSHVTAIAMRSGLEVTVDSVLLTRAFLAWGEDFTRQRAAASINRRDYIVFTAGILLTRLLEGDAVAVAAPAIAVGAPAIAAFWPKGFVCTEYCLTVLRAVLLQEFGESAATTALIDDLRVWWSFRENAEEDRASALGFFDLFAGSQPNWAFPTVAAQRPAMRAGASLR